MTTKEQAILVLDVLASNCWDADIGAFQVPDLDSFKVFDALGLSGPEAEVLSLIGGALSTEPGWVDIPWHEWYAEAAAVLRERS